MIPNRIELAARALWEYEGVEGVTFDDLGEYAQEDLQSSALKILKAAFPDAPGLFSDPPQVWLAPMEPTKEMLVEAEDRFEDFKDSDWDSDADGNRHDYTIIRSGFAYGMWIAARDAHLASQSDNPKGDAK